MLPIILSDFDFLFNYDDVINMTPDDSSIFATKQNPKKMKEFLQTTKLIKNKITHSNMNFIDSQKGTYNQYFKTTKRKIPEYISSRNGLLYSIMITTPIFIRDLFFLKGYDYFNTNNNELTAKNDFLFFKEYSHLNELQNITNTNTNKNTYTVVYNLGIHFGTDYTNISWLSNNKGCTNVGTSFVNTMSALVKYIEHLKDIEIYDNTRIIVVGDHGGRALNYIHFPDEQSLKQYPVDNDPILLYKDFNKRGNLVIDKTYMTVGDIPFLVLKDIVNKPINPFTNNQIIELTQKQKEAYPVCNTWGECFYNVHTEYREHQKCNDCKSNNCKSCELTLFRGM